MSTRSRGAGWLRAAATLVLLLGVVVGIPAVLAKGVGWPLPREVPDGDALKRIFDNNAITDDVVINALAVVVWIFWALLTVCVLAELVAALRGRRAGRVPLGGPLQSLAARLIAGIFTVSSLAAARPALAETTPLSAVLAQTTATTLPTAAQVATPPPEVAPVPEVRSYVVCPDDTLWDIAEAHLGNPQRWPEIFELNKGRSQPDGRWLRNPDLIRPGWKLDLPDDAVIPAADFPAPPSSTPAPAPAAVSPPTSSPAPTTPAGTVAAPTTVAPTTTAVPTTIAPAATSEAPSDPIPVQPVVDRNPIPKPRRVHSRPGVKLNGRSIIGAGLLAAGVVGVIDRRRRAQQRRRPAGQSLLLPQPDLAGCELALRISADPEGAELVDLALRAMADGVRAEGLRVPEVLGVRLRQRSLDILLASPLPDAPALFAARDGGRCWELPRGFDAEALHAAAEGVPAPLPALVSVGRTDDGGMLLIDVEEGGLTSVIGNPSEARAVLTAMATELATSRWVDDLSLVLVGFGDTLASLERVRVVDTVDEVLDGLEREAIGLSEALTAVGCPSAVDARVARTGEPTPTIVLCCADPLGAEATERLVRLTTAAGYAGVAAIVAGELPDALLYLRIDDGVVHVSPLGIDVVPQLLAPEEDDAIGELFDLAAAEPDDGLVAEDVVVDLTVEPDDGAPPEAPDMDDAEVLVRVLGPVEIVGPPPFQRAKAAELVVYLALHRGAAIGGDRLMEALWPARPPSSSNLNLNTSVARKALGRAVDGELHLPHVGSDRTYRLGQSVGVDYELFVGLVEQARLEEPDAARQSLRSALELVRGRPFDVVGRGYEWAHVEGIVTHLEAAVADAAHALAQLEIATGDAQGARWAAQQGLRASPGNEQLYRDQMYAANLNGNRAGVVAVMDELSHVLDDEDDDLLTQLHPETVSVYRELTGAGERAS